MLGSRVRTPALSFARPPLPLPRESSASAAALGPVPFVVVVDDVWAGFFPCALAELAPVATVVLRPLLACAAGAWSSCVARLVGAIEVGAGCLDAL